MAFTPRVAQVGARRDLTRRQLLGATVFSATVLGATGLTGCSLSNPAVDSPTTVPPPASGSPRPSPTAGGTPATPASTSLTKAASAEQQLALLATAISKRKGLAQDQRALLALVAAAHTEHARALAAPDPTGRPTSARQISATKISIDGVSTKNALKKLAAAEGQLASSHRRAAVGAKGLTALLWGSMAVAAETFQSVSADNPPPAGAVRKHKPMELVSDVQAVQAMVGQLHAIIYGYQLAIGKMPVVSKARARAFAGLLQRRVLRDRLISWLTSRDAKVPAAAAAYVPSVDPTNASTAGKLIRQMETALQPFCGLWLAAAGSGADRTLALTTLRSTNSTARSWGAGVRAWPGWSD